MLNVIKDYETDRNIAYSVTDTISKTFHSVIYKKNKKDWSCDCKYLQR